MLPRWNWLRSASSLPSAAARSRGLGERREGAMQDPFRLDGKVAVITGSSRGIGRETAMLMARLGAKVVVSSRKPEPCEDVAKAIRAEGGEALVIPCNVSVKSEVEALIKRTAEHWGGIDILVCNA